MAIMDSLLHFSVDGTPFDCNLEAGTSLITNQIDLGVTGRDPGAGQQMYMCFVVTTAFTDGGDAATLSLRLRSDSSAAIHATTSTGHITSPPILKAALAVGDRYVYPLPPAGTSNTYERYLGVQVVVATGFDAGNIEVFLTADPMGTNIDGYADASN